MSTSKDFRDYILEQLSLLDDIFCRPMMGEYLLYYKNTLFGGIYDSRLLFKVTNTNQEYAMEKVIPYKGAKQMFMFEELEDKDLLKKVVLSTYDGLK